MCNSFNVMDGMGSMMWSMGLIFTLVIMVQMLFVAALVQHLVG